jgi:hypothetical protein
MPNNSSAKRDKKLREKTRKRRHTPPLCIRRIKPARIAALSLFLLFAGANAGKTTSPANAKSEEQGCFSPSVAFRNG